MTLQPSDDFDMIAAQLGDERTVRLDKAVAYRWCKPDGEVLVIDPDEIEIVVYDEPGLRQRDLMMAVVVAAGAWRDISTDPRECHSSVALVAAVDAYREATRP